MHIDRQKEQFSIAYLHAIATVCGFTLSHPRVDDDSVDVTIGQTGGEGTIRSPKIEVQLKCTHTEALKRKGVHFQLKRKNYDDLRPTNLMVQRILVILLVPEKVEDWCQSVPEKQLILRRSAWWLSLRGADDKPGVEKPTVILPREQSFDAISLSGIINRVGRGELP